MSRLYGRLKRTDAARTLQGFVLLQASVADWDREYELTILDTGKVTLAVYELESVPMPGYVKARTTRRTRQLSEQVIQQAREEF